MEKASVSTPSNIRVMNSTQDSITLTWDDDWRASSYQVEVDGGLFLGKALENSFTKKGLSAGTEHNFRVRAVRGDSLGEWNGAVKEKNSKSTRILRVCLEGVS